MSDTNPNQGYTGIFSGSNPLIKFGKRAQEAVASGQAHRDEPFDIKKFIPTDEEKNKRAQEAAKRFEQFDKDPRNTPRHDSGGITNENSYADYNPSSEYDAAKNATGTDIHGEGFYEYGITPEIAAKIQEDLQNNQNNVKDYFSNSMTDTWKNLGEGDKKLLVLDQIGTTLRNLSKARLPMYSAYGKNYEGQGVGNEKSQLQKTLESSLQSGLQRRNDRLNSAMEEQIKVADFPAEQQMKLRDYWKTLQFNNDAKVDLINKLANVDYTRALKAWMIENPHAPIEDAFKAVEDAIAGIAAFRGTPYAYRNGMSPSINLNLGGGSPYRSAYPQLE